MNRFLSSLYESVGQSRINLSCFYIVAPLNLKDLFQVVFNIFIKDGAGNFNPVVNISWHQIGGSYVAFFIPIITEYHEPRMLQKAVNDPYCLNIFADILMPGTREIMPPIIRRIITRHCWPRKGGLLFRYRLNC